MKSRLTTDRRNCQNVNESLGRKDLTTTSGSSGEEKRLRGRRFMFAASHMLFLVEDHEVRVH